MRCSCRTVTDRFREVIRYDADPQSTVYQRPDGVWHAEREDWTRPSETTRTAILNGQVIQIPVHQDGCDLNNLMPDGHALDCATHDPLAHALTCPLSDWKWGFANDRQRAEIARAYTEHRAPTRRQLDALTGLDVQRPEPRRAICPICDEDARHTRAQLRKTLTRTTDPARRAAIRYEIASLDSAAITTHADLTAHGGICGPCFHQGETPRECIPGCGGTITEDPTLMLTRCDDCGAEQPL
jgi:hypothetical protein